MSFIRRLQIVSLCAVLAASAGLAQAQAADRDIVAVFKLRGLLTEAPDPVGLAELLGEKAPTNMFDLLEKLRSARSDKRVRAVIMEIQEAQLGLAQIQELRAQIETLRAADKDVWIFCDALDLGRLLLGSSASKLVLMPRGVVEVSGLYGEGLYFKNLLGKLGMEADMIHCGAYKSAGEPFYRTGPSKEAEEQQNRLLDSVFEQLIESVAKSRNIDPADLRALVDRAILSPKEALEARLVDKLAFREDFVKSIRKAYGKDAKVVRDYGKKKGPELDLENPFAVFGLFAEMMKGPKESDKPAIAVVYVEGVITTGESEPGLFGGSSNAGSDTVRKAIAEAADDEHVKALILRVDSPGGSAIASEVICEATKRFKKTGRPFVVSMGNVAGSGGYYVSCQGDTIFAEPGTITGSIGVVGGKFVTKGFWDWIGVTSHEYKRGKHADLMNSNRRFTDDERELITGLMTRIYGEFKDRVAEGRGKRLKGDLESLAGGRVYTGREAAEIGLVDRLGGFADAIKFAASEADLGSDYELRIFPRPKSIFDIFAEAFGKKEEDKFLGGPTGLPSLLSTLRREAGLASAAGAIGLLEPAKARALGGFLTQMELLARENVLLIGPPWMVLQP